MITSGFAADEKLGKEAKVLYWGVQKRGFKAIFFAQFLDPSRKNG